jgi:hypothetical protein
VGGGCASARLRRTNHLTDPKKFRESQRKIGQGGSELAICPRSIPSEFGKTPSDFENEPSDFGILPSVFRILPSVFGNEPSDFRI